MPLAGRTESPVTANLVRWQRSLIVVFPLVLFVLWTATILVLVDGPARWWAVAAVGIGAVVGLAVRTRPRRRAFLVPRELPPPPRVLVGRGDEIEELVSYLDRPLRSDSRLALVVGDPGVGKTTLVLKVAHLAARSFPDGQLFARFDSLLPPEERRNAMVRQFVDALKRPGESIPDDPDETFRRYIALVANRRVLIILDDVRRVDDLLRLRPPGRGNALVATSRQSWGRFLPAECKRVTLGPLAEADGLELLRRTVNRERIDEERGDALAIVQAAKGHPLALQAAAASLRHRPNTSLSRAVERIRAREDQPGAAHRAGVPAAADPLDVVFALLSEQERTALKLLGLLDQKELTPWRLSALRGEEGWRTEAGEQAAVRIIDRLVLAGLVERTREDAGGVSRFRVLDHVQDYARTLVKEEPREWRAERARLADAELARSLSGPAMSGGHVYHLMEQGQLRRAMSAARRALALAKDQGDAGSRALAYAVLAELNAELGGVEEARDLAQTAMNHARGGEARPRALRCIGKTHRRLRQVDAAVEMLGEARQAAEDIGDDSEQVRVLCELAVAHALGTDPARGRAAIDRAAWVASRSGTAERSRPPLLYAEAAVYRGEARLEMAGKHDPSRATALLTDAETRLIEAAKLAGQAKQQLSLTWIIHLRAQVALLGERHEDARAHARLALIQFNAMRHRYGVAQCRLTFGQAYLGEGRLSEARLALEEALEGFRNCGDRWVDAEASRVLARVRARAGKRGEAIQLLINAQRIFFSLGDKQSWQSTRDELDAMSSPLRRPFLQAELVPDPVAAFTVAAGATGAHP